MSYEVERFIPARAEDWDNGCGPTELADLEAMRYAHTRSPVGEDIRRHFEEVDKAETEGPPPSDHLAAIRGSLADGAREAMANRSAPREPIKIVPGGPLPPMGLPVWLWLETPWPRWIKGCRGDAGDGWTWCNCYGNVWYDGGWKTDTAEDDDDYAPTHFQYLPEPIKEGSER